MCKGFETSVKVSGAKAHPPMSCFRETSTRLRKTATPGATGLHKHLGSQSSLITMREGRAGTDWGTSVLTPRTNWTAPEYKIRSWDVNLQLNYFTVWMWYQTCKLNFFTILCSFKNLWKASIFFLFLHKVQDKTSLLHSHTISLDSNPLKITKMSNYYKTFCLCTIYLKMYSVTVRVSQTATFEPFLLSV